MTFSDYLSQMVWHFIGVYIINRKLQGHLEIRNFSSLISAWPCNKIHYYINTNEIPGEFLRENLISSHVKITPLL